MSVLLPATGTGTADVEVASDNVGGIEYPVTVMAGANSENSDLPKRIKTNDDGYLFLGGGTSNIGDVDVLTVPADPFGVNADAAATAGSTGSMQAKFRLMTSQLDAIKTALEIIDNWQESDRAKVNPIVGQAGVAGNVGAVSATTQRMVYGYPATSYHYNIAQQVHVAASNTVHWDMFNADASLVVRVLSIKQIPDVSAAVTGVQLAWLLERTTSVGTGGSTLTAWLADLNDTALDADITARSKPSGGASQSTDLVNYNLNADETNAGAIMLAALGGLELVPEQLRPMNGGKGIVLRQNQGLRCVQVTSSNQGQSGWLISFIVE